MARDFKRQEKLDAISELNVTPLIDLAFSLLIIFMITTPLMEQSIRVDIPVQAAGPAAPDEQQVETIAITASGAYHWGARQVAKDELASLLAQAAASPKQPVIHLRADRNLKFQSVVDVIDMVKKENLTHFSIDTQIK
ncbi:MAG: biopolymer transporter ExbD [Opitutales bacterium]|nr:biopolymer transporter ExbD [Opitutales bacterium]